MFSLPPKLALLTVLLISAVPGLAVDGEKLFLEKCAICHGRQGQGGVGIPLSLEAFLAQTPDEYIHRTIRVGRPGRVMPSFYRLTEAEIAAIIQHIRSWKPVPAPAWDATPISGDAGAGKALFNTHCIGCHGEDARGGKGTGLMFSRPRDLPIAPPALNNQGFLNSVSDAMLKTIITQGRKHTPMPAASQFGLSDADINNLVSYIRSFQITTMTGEHMLEEPAIIMVQSPYSFDQTVENIKQAVVDNEFELISFQLGDEHSADAAQGKPKKARINFCNYKMINDALAIDPRIGMFLPCQITVVEYFG
ncbi:MAG: c-type cytochrome, partial [Gammaproteobacteria bacterium]